MSIYLYTGQVKHDFAYLLSSFFTDAETRNYILRLTTKERGSKKAVTVTGTEEKGRNDFTEHLLCVRHFHTLPPLILTIADPPARCSYSNLWGSWDSEGFSYFLTTQEVNGTGRMWTSSGGFYARLTSKHCVWPMWVPAEVSLFTSWLSPKHFWLSVDFLNWKPSLWAETALWMVWGTFQCVDS